MVPKVVLLAPVTPPYDGSHFLCLLLDKFKEIVMTGNENSAEFFCQWPPSFFKIMDQLSSHLVGKKCKFREDYLREGVESMNDVTLSRRIALKVSADGLSG